MAAFPQLAVVGRGSNTCVYVIAIFTMCGSTEQRICIKFCFKIGKTATETYQSLQVTTRRQNSSRHSERVPRLRDQRRGAKQTMVMLLAFFDSEGIVHHEYAPDR